MKIAFYTTTILEYGGGLEKYLIETAAALAKQPGLTADIITMDDDFADQMANWLSIFYMKKMDKKLNYKEDLNNIKRRLGKAQYHKAHSFKELRTTLQNYDVIYSKNELLEAFLLKLMVGYRNLPPVIFGGHTPLCYPLSQSFHAKLHNALYSSRLYRYLADGVDKFHAINSYEAILYAKLFPKRQVAKIYNPFDINVFKQNAKKNIYNVSKQKNTIRILWVGRLTEQKGVQDLANVVRYVNKGMGPSQKRISWHIFGDGELRNIVDDLATEQSNVTCYGHMDQKYMASVYAQHDMFLSTSRWEGYPYTLIEPQAFGLQIFAYRIPGVTDILQAYAGGNLADNQAVMIDLLITQLQRHINTGDVPRYQASSQFEPDGIYQQLVELLSKGTA
jgi:glycosyltransferase involved in cell wall biosynthesis